MEVSCSLSWGEGLQRLRVPAEMSSRRQERVSIRQVHVMGAHFMERRLHSMHQCSKCVCLELGGPLLHRHLKETTEPPALCAHTPVWKAPARCIS